MAKAIFDRDFNYSSRRRGVGWAVTASPDPRTYPRELIDAAVKAGVAREVPPRRKAEVKTPK